MDHSAPNCVAVAWSRGGVEDADYKFAFLHCVVPLAKRFNPDLVLVSCGFDGVEGDEQGGCNLSPK